MKKLYFNIAVLMVLMVQVSTAQTQLWGVASYGGALDSGTIFVADGNGNNLHSVYSCHEPSGAYPWGGLCLAPNGKLYGVTFQGGCSNQGVCFNYDPSTGIWTDFHDLHCDPTHGYEANSRMMVASDGNLYGMCGRGGAHNLGVIYKVDPTTDTYTDIYDFIDSTGGNGGDLGVTLIQLNDGKLYGTTWGGGPYGYGVIFSFNPVTTTYTMLHPLSYAIGGRPCFGGLLNASNGKLYGMSSEGSTNNTGVIFSYDVASDTYTNVHHFIDSTGEEPNGGLIQATDGKLYGMTPWGGSNNDGVIFSFDTSGTYSVLFNFDSINGKAPFRSLMYASNGLLYGSTQVGGTNGGGVFFSYDITTSTYTVLANMDSTIGIYPDCDIIEVPEVTTGIKAIKHVDNSITIYPNPANSAISIQQTIASANEVVTISDVLGNKIYEQVISNTASLITTVDISKWSKGVYLVQLRDDKETLQKKLVVE